MKLFSVLYMSSSSLFLFSTSSWRFLSSSDFSSASLTILSTSSLDSPLEASTLIFCSFCVARSLAETWSMPSASMSNVTSTCGIPLAEGGMPSSMNLASVLLSAAICLSPWSTWISTEVWLSSAVVNTWLFFVGIVVFLSIIFVITPPRVSIPSDSGVTSSRRTSLTSPPSTAPCMAAPIATTSSGLMPLWGSFPKKSVTTFWTSGILVEPPTSITSSMSPALTPASLSA